MAQAQTYYVGARCTWHGSAEAIEQGRNCCPHCNGKLYDYPNKATWNAMVMAFDKKHPGYIEFANWLGEYGRCWPNPVVASKTYTLVTGKEVQLGT